ncbi:hypothetical protein PGKDCPLP_01839 [Stenotrophomonas maltophilia]|nr:hypothetical protein PGKDCPLP_01839 [Stenotrophomonas maltophilia]
MQDRHQRGADRRRPQQFACRLRRASQRGPQRTGRPAAEAGPADAVVDRGRCQPLQHQCGDERHRNRNAQPDADADRGPCHVHPGTRLLRLATLAPRFDPQQVAGVEQEGTAKAEQEVQPDHYAVAELAEVQGIGRAERGVVGVALAGQLRGQDVAGGHVQCHRAERAERAGGFAGDLDGGVGIAGVGQLQVGRFEIGHALCAGHFKRACMQHAQAARRCRDAAGVAHRRGVHCGWYRLQGLAVVDQRVEQGHLHEHQAEQGASDREHQVEGQAEHADHVVRVLPQLFQVAARTQREQITEQLRQVDHQAAEQGHAIQQADDAHHVDAGHWQSEAVMQLVDQFGQPGLWRRGAAGDLSRPGVAPAAVIGLPVGQWLRVFGAGEGHADVAARFRMRGKHVLQQVLRVVQAGGECGGCTGRLPQRQVVVEQGQRTRVEGHEQAEAGNQADPGVQGGERAQRLRTELHGKGLIAPRRSGAAAQARRSRWRRCHPAPATHAARCGN